LELKELYSVSETVALLGVARSTVYVWRDEGKLTEVRKGVAVRRMFITAESIRAVLEQAGHTLEGRIAELNSLQQEDSLEEQNSTNNRTPLRVAA
jgi:predicted site-specific integrase-resolvase